MKKINLHYALILLLTTMGTQILLAQGHGPNSLDEFETDISLLFQESNRDSLITWQEKVVIHLSDNVVGSKDAIFFKGYLLTGLNQIRLNMSNVLNVELVDVEGQVIKRQYHPIEDGMVTGNLVLPKKIKDGKYYLKAYTRWMKNYDEASYAVTPIFIGDNQDFASDYSNQGSEISVMPEGGKLVSGLMNRLVFTVPATVQGNELLRGQIVDEKGNTVGEVTQYTKALFTGGFIPEDNKSYQLKLSSGQMISIPEAKDEGYVLQVNNLDPQKASVRVGTSKDNAGRIVKLLGSMNGVTYLEKYININESGQVDFEISKTAIPRGILHLRLVEKEGVQLAHRPIWIDGNQLNIDIQPMGGNESDELAVRIRVTDQDNNPVQTEIALGINELKADKSPQVEEISTFNANELFVNNGNLSRSIVSDNDRRERFLRDIKLLASAEDLEHLSYSTDNGSDDILYPFQQGLDLYGYAYDMDNKILPNTEIQVMAMSESEAWAQDIKTDSDGRIFLEDMQLIGEARLIFRTRGDETKDKFVKVIPAKNQFQNNSKTLQKDINVKESKRVYEPSNYQLRDTTGLITLDEVILKEKSLEKRATPSLYNIEPTHVRYQDPERIKSLPELLLNIPGLIVGGLGTLNPYAFLQRGGNLLWVVDGFPVAKAAVLPSFDTTVNPSSQPQKIGRASSTQLAEVMTLVSAIDVDKIELLVGADAAFFGSRASGGVIMIYTRGASNLDRVMRKDAQLVFQGYESNLDFKSYMENKSRRARQDVNTLYWNPSIQTDEEGVAVIRLKSADVDGNLYLKASTVTTDGRIGVYESVLKE